jgi:hypothetical protein
MREPGDALTAHSSHRILPSTLHVAAIHATAVSRASSCAIDASAARPTSSCRHQKIDGMPLAQLGVPLQQPPRQTLANSSDRKQRNAHQSAGSQQPQHICCSDLGWRSWTTSWCTWLPTAEWLSRPSTRHAAVAHAPGRTHLASRHAANSHSLAVKVTRHAHATRHHAIRVLHLDTARAIIFTLIVDEAVVGLILTY